MPSFLCLLSLVVGAVPAWAGQIGDQLTITLNFNTHTKRGTLWFASPALHDLVNKSLYTPAD